MQRLNKDSLTKDEHLAKIAEIEADNQLQIDSVTETCMTELQEQEQKSKALEEEIKGLNDYIDKARQQVGLMEQSHEQEKLKLQEELKK